VTGSQVRPGRMADSQDPVQLRLREHNVRLVRENRLLRDRLVRKDIRLAVLRAELVEARQARA
jgi:hypothetical protein